MRTIYIAAAVFAVVYVAMDLNKLHALRYGADLGTYLQTLVNLQHGSSWNYGEWRPHFTVHDSWALTALVPLVAIFPRAETLIVVQVLAVAAAAIPLVLFARESGVDARGASLIGIAYLLTPSAQGISYDNFSESVFVPLLAFCGALFARRRALWPTLLFGQLLMGIKEDQIIFVLWFGIACALWWDRRIGVTLSALAVFNGVGYWLVERALHVVPNVPPYGLTVSDPSGKLTMLFLLLAPFAFAPVLIGRWLLLGAPLLAEIIFMQPWNYEPSRVGSHYTAALLAATALAAVYGVRQRHAFARAMPICAAIVMLFIFNDTVLRPGRWPFIVDWRAYARAVDLRDRQQSVLLQRGDEGVWAVAAANPNVRLDPHPDLGFAACPGYNTNAGAFFASLAGKMPARLCGGVPVKP